jgi:hypothetical protein
VSAQSWVPVARISSPVSPLVDHIDRPGERELQNADDTATTLTKNVIKLKLLQDPRRKSGASLSNVPRSK